MRREDGQLFVGSDGSPLPNCVTPDSGSALCTQPNFRPLSTKFTGGNSSTTWLPVQIKGTSDNNITNAVTIASIGNSGLPGIPAFFAGNGDPTVAVEVSTSLHVAQQVSVSLRCSAVCRCSSAGLNFAVLPTPMLPFLCSAEYLTRFRFGSFSNQVSSGRLLSPVLSVTPSSPIRYVVVVRFFLCLKARHIFWGRDFLFYFQS
jgi:hypothetical protein